MWKPREIVDMMTMTDSTVNLTIWHSQYKKDHIDNHNVMIYWYQYMNIS